ncbi:MAG TPA: CCA tRNA nucleotidyltransferase, partial [Candidatus Glassbacteria bacterium]|nr:CCA tRNA nucleotidyltransferase [Candidatus Glassbacteria bacterium]
NYELVSARLRELSAEQIRPPRLVSGDDLIAMGYPPGHRFKKILQAVEDAQLEGQISSREEAEQFVREHFQ